MERKKKKEEHKRKEEKNKGEKEGKQQEEKLGDSFWVMCRLSQREKDEFDSKFFN